MIDRNPWKMAAYRQVFNMACILDKILYNNAVFRIAVQRYLLYCY